MDLLWKVVSCLFQPTTANHDRCKQQYNNQPTKSGCVQNSHKWQCHIGEPFQKQMGFLVCFPKSTHILYDLLIKNVCIKYEIIRNITTNMTHTHIHMETKTDGWLKTSNTLPFRDNHVAVLLVQNLTSSCMNDFPIWGYSWYRLVFVCCRSLFFVKAK